KLPSSIKELVVYCVGEGTAELTREAGFARVVTGSGRARDLVALLARDVEAGGPPVAHIAGEHLPFGLSTPLPAQGIPVRRITAYEAHAITSLSAEVARAIAGRTIDAVLLMSPRASTLFAELLQAAGLARGAESLTFICLSDTVAAPLGALG